jgi:hypothetical protein
VIRQELIPLAAYEDWEQALAGIDHAFAHTWASCHAMQHTTGWPTFLYRFDGGDRRFACPIAQRTFEGAIDVVTPSGFAGFVGHGDSTGLLEHWTDFAREQGWVCSYIALNPFVGVSALNRTADAHRHHDLFVLDLRQEQDTLFQAMSANRRRQIGAWRREGGRLRTDAACLKAFVLEHHAQFMTRRGAAGPGALTRETLNELLDLDHVFVIGSGDPEITAATMFAFSPALGEFLGHVSLPGEERHSAVLIWAGLLRLRDMGVPVLNLGGGIRPGDGVAEFKRRFGATAVASYNLKQVFDVPRYAQLCGMRDVDPNDRSGYFPAYQNPRA